MARRIALIVHGIVGWAVCGATIMVGREITSMGATLVIHAVVAPTGFALLTWHYFRRYPDSSPLATALVLLGTVVGLDAFLVAPVFEHSYAMFQSPLGTWIPFASILAASYVAGRLSIARRASRP